MNVKYANIVGKVIDSEVFAIIQTVFSAISSIHSLKMYVSIQYDEHKNMINPLNHSFLIKEINSRNVELIYKNRNDGKTK